MSESLEILQQALSARYALNREIGRGGMATVYLAHDLRHDREVAFKVLNSDLGAAIATERFLREIRIVARLQHPHVLPLYDSGECDGVFYYVTPFLSGDTLRARLNSERTLPIGQAIRVATEVTSALDFAHGHGIIHRDIKPENILFQAGHAIVADFGIARAVVSASDQPLTDTGIAIGTPIYMSPEQASGERTLDGRSDVYSLGCVLYEMLTGEPPFTGLSPSAAIRRRFVEPAPSPRKLRPDISATLDETVLRALAREPVDRFQNAAELLEALETEGVRSSERTGAQVSPNPAVGMAGLAEGAPRPKSRTAKRAGIVGIALATVGITAVLVRTPPGDVRVTPNRIAVAPFTVARSSADPALGEMRDVLFELLATQLNGAGSLTTVPTNVIQHLTERSKELPSDSAGAAALGQRTGAQYVVVGRILRVAAGTVSVRAEVFDVGRGARISDSPTEKTGPLEAVHALADSVTMAVLYDLGMSGAVAELRRYPLGTRSVKALKAFVQGERLYRKSAWDAAVLSYERAIAEDSTFALAMRRAGLAMSWQRDALDSLSREYLLRAGQHNRGLAARDSLLVAADSLRASLATSEFDIDIGHLSRVRRLFRTLDLAIRRNATDSEAWYTLGDAYFHYGFGSLAASSVELTDQRILDAFDRAIALDSTFGPAYIHAIELALNVEGAASARRYIRAYLALDPRDAAAQGIRVVDAVIDSSRSRSPNVQALLDTASADALFTAWATVRRWPDSAETAIRLAQLPLKGRQTSSEPAMERRRRRSRLLLQLARNGHLREAYKAVEESLDPRDYRFFSELTLMGGVPADTAAAVFGRWLRSPWMTDEMKYPPPATLAWWAEHRDSTSLRRFRARADSVVATATTPTGRRSARYQAASGEAYLALARGDTAAALRLLSALTDTLCLDCYVDRLTKARLLMVSGRNREAQLVINERLYHLLAPTEIVFTMTRARIAERLDERDVARRAYSEVATAWAKGDPELQPIVAEALAGLKRLGSPEVTGAPMPVPLHKPKSG